MSFNPPSTQDSAESDETPWSEWIWSEDHRQYYRRRFNDGTWQNQWQSEYNEEFGHAATRPANQPRSGGMPAQDLSDTFAQLNVNATVGYEHGRSQSDEFEGYSYQPRDTSAYYPSSNDQHAYGTNYTSRVDDTARYRHTSNDQITYQSDYANPSTGDTYGNAGASSPTTNLKDKQVAYTKSDQTDQSQANEAQQTILLQTFHDGLDHEKLDRSYERVRKESIKAFFREGRVLAMLWIEPSNAGPSGNGFSIAKYGTTAFAEIRRFIIVKPQGKFHSICVPIMSYGGKGVVERSDAREHAIAYTGDYPPLPLPGENMDRHAIKIEPRGGNILNERSRINFSKIYTIEHNLKVKNIGSVPKEYMSWVSYYYRQSNIGMQPPVQPTFRPQVSGYGQNQYS